MTKIKNIKDLKVGDEVTVTVTGRISHVYPEDNYANLDFETHAEYISISDEYLDDGIMTVDRPPKPLPTDNGVYVPSSNADFPEGSYLFFYDDRRKEGPWSVFDGYKKITGEQAEREAKNSHLLNGGLVPLVPKG